MRRPGPTPLATAHQGGGLPAGEVSSGLRLRRQPQHRRSNRPHSRQLRVDQEEPAALPDRRPWHRQVPHTHRPGHRGRHKGVLRPLHAGHKIGERAGRGRRREQLNKTIARYGRIDLFETESLRVRRCRVLRSVVGEGETDRCRLQRYLVLGLTVRLSGGDLSSAAPADQVQAMAACRALAAAH